MKWIYVGMAVGAGVGGLIMSMWIFVKIMGERMLSPTSPNAVAEVIRSSVNGMKDDIREQIGEVEKRMRECLKELEEKMIKLHELQTQRIDQLYRSGTARNRS